MFIWIADSWSKGKLSVDTHIYIYASGGGGAWHKKRDILRSLMFFFALFFLLLKRFLLRFFTISHSFFTLKHWKMCENEWDSVGKTSFACLIIRIPRSFDENITNFCVWPINVVFVFVFYSCLPATIAFAGNSSFYAFLLRSVRVFCMFLPLAIHFILYDHFHDLGTEIAEEFMTFHGWMDVSVECCELFYENQSIFDEKKFASNIFRLINISIIFNNRLAK